MAKDPDRSVPVMLHEAERTAESEAIPFGGTILPANGTVE